MTEVERNMARLFERLRRRYPERVEDVLALLILEVGGTVPLGSSRYAIIARFAERVGIKEANAGPKAVKAYFDKNPLPKALMQDVVMGLREGFMQAQPTGLSNRLERLLDRATVRAPVMGSASSTGSLFSLRVGRSGWTP